MCVPLVVTGILLSCKLLCFQQGVAARQRAYHQRRHSLSLGETGTDHPSAPASIFNLYGKALMQINAVTHDTPSPCRSAFALSFSPHFRLQTPRPRPLGSVGPFRIWVLRLASTHLHECVSPSESPR